MTLELYFYQAECGDAARICFKGTDEKYHNIFIDSGFERTYHNVLADEIHSIKNKGEVIDLWIISHIHDDHIGGVIAYINAIEDGEISDIVQAWYYNPPRPLYNKTNSIKSSAVSKASSIEQGDSLMAYLFEVKKNLRLDISSALSPQDFFGLKITVLSPSIYALAKLREKYPIDGFRAFELNEMDSISEATSTRGSDYHIPIESFNLDGWKEDDSVENGSSISILTEYNGKKILWLADSHPSVIVQSLKKMGYSNNNPLICDWVKVTHHGSKANNSKELFDLIRCNNYLMSVNGQNRHYLPSKECIARILLNSNRPTDSHYNFYFTYDNHTLRSIFRIDSDEVFIKWNFTIHYLSDNKWIISC